MANLNTKIKLYLEANSETWDNTKVELQDDSDDKGVYIKTWNYDIPNRMNSVQRAHETALRAAKSRTVGDEVQRSTESEDDPADRR